MTDTTNDLHAIDTAVMSVADKVAELIADWFGRAVEDTDRDLAVAIIALLVLPSRETTDAPGGTR